MFFPNFTLLLSLFALFTFQASAQPIDERSALKHRQTTCSVSQKIAGVQHEIDTINSHSFADADQIPLAPLASRTFYITPTELGGGITLPPVNVGFTAATVRTELVLLATALNAAVPASSVHYTANSNGSITSDFIQTDQIVLPSVQVREIHDFDSNCQITRITGYVHGSLLCGTLPVANSILQGICNDLDQLLGDVVGGVLNDVTGIL